MLSMPLCANGFCKKTSVSPTERNQTRNKKSTISIRESSTLVWRKWATRDKKYLHYRFNAPFSLSLSHFSLSLYFSRATAFYACIVFIRLCYVTDVVINNKFLTLLRNGNSLEINYGNSRTGALFSLSVSFHISIWLWFREIEIKMRSESLLFPHDHYGWNNGFFCAKHKGEK